MAGLTLEQLQAMGAKPVEQKTGGLTLQQLQGMGATEVSKPIVRQGVEMAKRPLFRRIENKVGGFAEGVGQSVIGTIQGAGTLIEKGLQKTLDPTISRITGVPQEQLKGGELFTPGTEQFETVKRMSTPQTSEQKAGKFVGDAAQFIVPGTNIAKATAKAPLAVRLVSQAVTDMGIASAQQGEIDDDTLFTGLVSAGLPVAGMGIKKIGQALRSSETAGKIINSLVKPLKKDFAYGKNPGKAIAEEGITASSLDELGEKVQSVLDTKNNEYLDIIKKTGGEFDVSDVFNPLETAKQTAVKQNNQTLLNRIQTMETALRSNLKSITDDAGNQIIQVVDTKDLTRFTPEQILDLKKALGEMTQFTGNASDDTVINKALKSVYGNLKQKLDEAVPGSSKLSERIADLVSAKSSITNRAAIAQRNNLIEFTPKTIGGAGIIASLATMNPVPVLIGAGIAGIEKAFSTTSAKTKFASWLASASKQQKQELYKAMPELRGLINALIVE